MDNKNKKKGNRGNKGQKGGQKQNWSFKEPEFFTTSLTGFLITSNQHQEKNAVKDAYNFLNKYVDRDYEREIQDILDGLDVPEKKVKLDQPFEEKKEDGENAGNTEPAPKVENEGGSTEPQEKQEQQAQEIVEVKAEAEPAEKKVQENAAAMLEKELKSLQKDKRLFYNVETNCKGIIFIKINPLFKDVLDVKHVANKIVRDVRENKIPVSRFCFKLIPIEVACKAALNTFQENIKPMIERKFKADRPRKWVLHFKCRNNNKFTQQPFLDYILEIIGQGHSVDFKNPDYVIFVEINNHLMTLSILKKFLKYKNYSLQLPDSNPAQKPKTDKPKEAGDSSVPKPSLVGELEFDVPETNEPEGEEQAQGETKPEPEGEDEEDEVPLL